MARTANFSFRIYRLIGRETLGASRCVRVEFETDAPVSEVISALEQLTGPHGWPKLRRKTGLA
jgi:hypothetical protein